MHLALHFRLTCSRASRQQEKGQQRHPQQAPPKLAYPRRMSEQAEQLCRNKADDYRESAVVFDFVVAALSVAVTITITLRGTCEVSREGDFSSASGFNEAYRERTCSLVGPAIMGLRMLAFGAFRDWLFGLFSTVISRAHASLFALFGVTHAHRVLLAVNRFTMPLTTVVLCVFLFAVQMLLVFFSALGVVLFYHKLSVEAADLNAGFVVTGPTFDSMVQALLTVGQVQPGVVVVVALLGLNKCGLADSPPHR